MTIGILSHLNKYVMQKFGYNYVLGINVTEFYALCLAEVDFGTFYISVHIYSKHRTSREGLEK